MLYYEVKVETLEGEFTDLSKYKGQILLVINVATFCGKFIVKWLGYQAIPNHISAYTQQYIDFNPLIEKNLAQGRQFAILGFPCNQFYLQEPAENHEIMNGLYLMDIINES
jgi:glutathione peroxidase